MSAKLPPRCHVAALQTAETAVSGGGESKLVEIPKVKVALPRGRFDLELYPRHAKLVGSNPYRIPFENVARMYHLPSAKGDATVMFIHDASRFGLAQLHQLRGRIGRGTHHSFCVLFVDEKDEEAEQLAMGTVIRGKYQLLRTLAGANLGRCGKRGYCMMSRWKRRCRQRMKRVRWRRW